MEAISFSVEFAWRTAAEEALQAGSEFIEPEHLLIGLCSIEKIFSMERPHVQLSGYSLAAIRFEWQDFLTRLLSAGPSPSVLRESTRKALKLRPAAKPSRRIKMSRSQATRAIFARAEVLAKAAGSCVLGLTYLFAAMIENDGPTSSFLREQGVDIDKLRDSTMAAANRRLQPKTLKELSEGGAQISSFARPPLR